MAIDRIPGVGPANSDIAATIATTPAVSAQITANVPSAASIASAVAAPSLASITSAITTNAASAGLTNASIASTGNSNNWNAGSITWTQIGFSTANATSINFTGISGYKYLRFVVQNYQQGANSNWQLRFNGVSTNTYMNWGYYIASGATTPSIYPPTTSADSIPGMIGGVNMTVNQTQNMIFDIDNANNTLTYKNVKAFGVIRHTDSNNWSYINLWGAWNSGSSAITSVLLTSSSGVNFVPQANSAIYLFGGN